MLNTHYLCGRYYKIITCRQFLALPSENSTRQVFQMRGKITAKTKVYELSYSPKTHVLGPEHHPALLSPEPRLPGTELQFICSLKGLINNNTKDGTETGQLLFPSGESGLPLQFCLYLCKKARVHFHHSKAAQ